MQNKQTIEEYYNNPETLQEIFSSVKNPQWHAWVIEDSNGKFRHNKKKINSIKRLYDFLLNIKFDKGKAKYVATSEPSKVYVSIAEFLHPETVFGKIPKRAQYLITDTMFLGSYLLYDFDGDNALNDAKSMLEYMKSEPGYKLLNIRNTSRGFHLTYEDLNPVKTDNPITRLKMTQYKREQLVYRLPKLETLDIKVIPDQFRVHAALGTVKGTTGHKVELISELKLKRMRRFRPSRPVRPIQRPMITDDTILTSKQGKEGTGLTSYPHYYHFITDKVKGAKGMHITVLKYPKTKKIDIKKIQTKYKLSHFFKFIYKNVKMYINFKVVSKERLVKIMRYAKPMNLNSFMYYGHTWIPLSEAVDSKGNIVWGRPELVEIIESVEGIKDTHSRPHAKILNLTFEKMAGQKINRICKAIISEKN